MTIRQRLAEIAASSPLPTCPLRTCANMEEINLALGLQPDADTRQACERARTLRQTEVWMQEISQRRITCR